MSLKNVIKNNEIFVNSVNEDVKLKNCLDELIKGQNPKVLVITCSDSRVIPENIFSSTFGEMFVIRTAGNVINEGELASIEYGIEHLHVETVIVLGHTSCGAIHASIHQEQGKYLSPILNRIYKNIEGIIDEEEASKINARKERDYIKTKFPMYKGEIVSMIYNLKSRKVEIC